MPLTLIVEKNPIVGPMGGFNPLWQIHGKSFTAIGTVIQYRNEINNILHEIILDTSYLTSNPVLILTQNDEWLIITTTSNSIKIIESSSLDAINQPIIFIAELTVPYLTHYMNVSVVPMLSSLRLQIFNPDILDQLYDAMEIHLSLQDLNTKEGYISPVKFKDLYIPFSGEF